MKSRTGISELWKDDRLNMLDAKGWYFDCFEIGYHALRRYRQKLKWEELDLHLGMTDINIVH